MSDNGGVRRLLPLVLLAAVACTGQVDSDNHASGPRQNQTGTLPTGVFRQADREPAPELSGETLDGTDLSVSDLRGKVVVVNFWASWCAPCRAEAGNLNKVYTATKDLGVEFVGVDIKDEKTAARAFQRSAQVPYPSLFDQDGALLLRFRKDAPQTPPTTLILDREGRVAARFVTPVRELQLLGPVQVIAKETG